MREEEFNARDSVCASGAGIKNIDYLVGLERLVKLQLDNNNITKIENLEHLHTLTDLGMVDRF